MIEKNGFFFTRDGLAIPPGVVLEEEDDLVVRFQSTRAGNNARWVAGERALTVVRAGSGARYEPTIRAHVRGFVWFPAQTRDCPMSLRHAWGEPPETWAYQLGTAVLNWSAEVMGPLPDPLGDYIRTQLVLPLQPTEVDYRQGHLTVGRLGDMPELEELWLVHGRGAGSGTRELYNHAFLGANRWVYRVVECEGQRNAVLLFAMVGGGAILSSDHPDQPVLGFGDGWYVATHPVPAGRDVD